MTNSFRVFRDIFSEKIYSSGYSLTELLVVILMTAIIAGLMLPKMGKIIERQRAQEGRRILEAVLASQERWRLDHNSYSSDNAGWPLDIDQAASSNFLAPDIINAGNPGVCPSGVEAASIDRRTNDYGFTICSNGKIICRDMAAGSPCGDLGF